MSGLTVNASIAWVIIANFQSVVPTQPRTAFKKSHNWGPLMDELCFSKRAINESFAQSGRSSSDVILIIKDFAHLNLYLSKAVPMRRMFHPRRPMASPAHHHASRSQPGIHPSSLCTLHPTPTSTLNVGFWVQLSADSSPALLACIPRHISAPCHFQLFHPRRMRTHSLSINWRYPSPPRHGACRSRGPRQIVRHNVPGSHPARRQGSVALLRISLHIFATTIHCTILRTQPHPLHSARASELSSMEILVTSNSVGLDYDHPRTKALVARMEDSMPSQVCG